MPNPHFDITITSRSKGMSAVAGAAYQSGERIFSEYDQKYKDYSKRKDVTYTQILLPPNAPPEYAHRAVLWNAVEEIEKQWNSQLARRFVLAIPKEVPAEYYPQMVTDYCEEHFVSKGMCCDLAIHDPDPPGHNPHCHVMLTMRALDEQGHWLSKSRKVYELDENGERIRLPSGNWKCRKENTVDWNEQYHGEEWRHGWETVQNRYLEIAGSLIRVDLRSYERQGLDKIPTVHMGPAVTQMERRGIQTNVGNLNRDIRSANRMMQTIRETIAGLREWIHEILTARKDLLAKQEVSTSPNLVNLLHDYLDLRKEQRREWSRYGQQKGTTDDLKAISNALIYLQDHKLFTLKDLDESLQRMQEKAKELRSEMKLAESRLKTISNIKSALSDCQANREIHDKYIRIGWKTRQAVFAEKYKNELESYNKAYRYLRKQGVDLNVDLQALQEEWEQLNTSHATFAKHLTSVREELKPMKEIRYWIEKVLVPDSKVAEIPEPKHSVKDQMIFLQEQEKNTREHKAPQKKQNREM